MNILAFETSCDDTSIALFENEKLVSMQTKSQIKIHNITWGVVPEVASREHANVIFDVLDAVLTEGSITLKEIDYIAVTTHPWLVPSLLTGITVASSISQALRIPIIPIDHIEAHIFSAWLERDEFEIVFPLVCLTVSWWHNEIWYMQHMWKKEKLWQTQDDAAGEAYDKVAKMIGWGYPWGPIIAKLASEYASESYWDMGTKHIKNLSLWGGDTPKQKRGLFPRVYLEKSEFGFSFSGLKSAVKREVDTRKLSLSGVDATKWQKPLTLADQQEIAFEFQNAVNEVLAYKLLRAAEEKWVKTLLLAGGVSANDDLNTKIAGEAQKRGLHFFAPKKKLYCMDNAAMIGMLAYYRVKYGRYREKYGIVQVGEK